jgi:uncharacterized phage-like protein YoqJ
MVTGHRQLVPAGWQGSPWPENNQPIQAHHEALVGTMTSFCHQMGDLGHDTFITGMAIGADQLFAEAVMRHKIARMCRLVAAVPFAGQESKWPQASQAKYNHILSFCDHVQIVSEGSYSPQKMQIRNVWMVDNADVVLAVWDGKRSGGTWNCLTYALEQGKMVLRLNPATLEFGNVTL